MGGSQDEAREPAKTPGQRAGRCVAIGSSPGTPRAALTQLGDGNQAPRARGLAEPGQGFAGRRAPVPVLWDPWQADQ